MATSGQPGPGDKGPPAGEAMVGDGKPAANGRAQRVGFRLPAASPPVVGPRAAHPTRQPARWRRNVLLIVALVAGAWLALAWSGLREKALVSTAFAARTGCVCRFVSQRALASCKGDLGSAGLGRMARLVSLSEDAATRTVRASVPLLARQSADYRAERGCRLEPWRE